MLTNIDQSGASLASMPNMATAASRTCIASFLTELGWMAIAWHDDVVQGNAFGHASRRSAELALAESLGSAQAFCRVDAEGQADELPAWLAGTIDLLQRFALGEPVDFSAVPLSLAHLTPFGKRVVAGCRRIAWGTTRSYGELAAACGSPGAARAVGSVMAKNRYPLIVPCHRVLGAGGGLGGYSAPDGLKMKRRLLAMEQVATMGDPK